MMPDDINRHLPRLEAALHTRWIGYQTTLGKCPAGRPQATTQPRRTFKYWHSEGLGWPGQMGLEVSQQ
jgi:hypothetical protein